MKLVTVSLKDGELKALMEICKIQNISCLHRAIKTAIGEFIEHSKERALQ